jgi:ankyrin repeat protein
LATAIAFANSTIADTIHNAAEGFDCAAINTVLQEDPSFVNLKDSRGRTPLLCALGSWPLGNNCGLKNTIKLLVANHADISVRDKDGNTVVHYAVGRGLDIVKLFVGLDGISVTATNNAQETPLHVAMRLGRNDIAEFLIASGVHVDAKDKDGLTPLHIAVQRTNTDMVRLLLKYHADINARTKDGKTPYTLAHNDNDSTLQRFIRKNGGHE